MKFIYAILLWERVWSRTNTSSVLHALQAYVLVTADIFQCSGYIQVKPVPCFKAGGTPNFRRNLRSCWLHSSKVLGRKTNLSYKVCLLWLCKLPEQYNEQLELPSRTDPLLSRVNTHEQVNTGKLPTGRQVEWEGVSFK